MQPAWAEQTERPAPAPGRRSGRVAMIGLVTSAAISAALIWFVVPLADMQTWLRGTADLDRIDALDGAAGTVGLVIAIAYLVWSWRITSAIPALTGTRPRVGRVGAVGWWFVPLANLVMPPVVLGGLLTGLVLPGRRRLAWLVPLWWLALLGSRATALYWGARLSGLQESFTADAVQAAAATGYLVVSEALSMVAALALVVMIARIERDADQRGRVAAGERPWPGASGAV